MSAMWPTGRLLFFCSLFVELLIVMRAIIVRGYNFVFSKARHKIKRKTISLLATSNALNYIYKPKYSVMNSPDFNIDDTIALMQPVSIIGFINSKMPFFPMT